ncbi:Methylthioribose kinase [Anaerolineales bacterium]|nr:Methylthioribose kinase [Anaerolineales bacterium]
MKLPDSFISTIRSTFKEEGERFLAILPDLISETSHRWGLTNIQPVSNLSYNFVAFAKRLGRSAAQSKDVVLKVGVPNRELTSGIAALKFFDGNGACQLLESDAEHGLLLLERLKPGKMLVELEDDDERTRIAADLISCRGEITSPLLQPQLIQLSDWFEGLKKIRPHFNGGTGPFPGKLLEQVESSLPELFADKNVKLMHGDFHHFNILSSERGWLVIDPKGVIGPVGYEVGPLMLNPWNSPLDRIRLERRVSILTEKLGWERESIVKWATAHAVLSAWWDIQDGMDGGRTIHCAEIFSEMK